MKYKHEFSDGRVLRVGDTVTWAAPEGQGIVYTSVVTGFDERAGTFYFNNTTHGKGWEVTRIKSIVPFEVSGNTYVDQDDRKWSFGSVTNAFWDIDAHCRSEKDGRDLIASGQWVKVGDPSPKPAKLEVGKCYRDEDGHIRKVMCRRSLSWQTILWDIDKNQQRRTWSPIEIWTDGDVEDWQPCPDPSETVEAKASDNVDAWRYAVGFDVAKVESEMEKALGVKQEPKPFDAEMYCMLVEERDNCAAGIKDLLKAYFPTGTQVQYQEADPFIVVGYCRGRLVLAQVVDDEPSPYCCVMDPCDVEVVK